MRLCIMSARRKNVLKTCVRATVYQIVPAKLEIGSADVDNKDKEKYGVGRFLPQCSDGLPKLYDEKISTL